MDIKLPWSSEVTVDIKKVFAFSILVVCLIPIILNLGGVDFSSSFINKNLSEILTNSEGKILDDLSYLLNGSFIHTILEWSSVCVAMMISLLSFFTYKLRPKNIEIPVIGFALFFSGCIDAYHTLATDKLLAGFSVDSELLPFSWLISRLFHVLIIVSAISFSYYYVRKNQIKTALENNAVFAQEDSKKNKPLLNTFGVFLLSSIIYLSVYFLIGSEQFFNAEYLDLLKNRIFGVLPLLIWVFAIPLIYKFFNSNNSLYSFSLLVLIIPEVIAEMHMVFGSEKLFDNHFNVAHGIKFIAYAVPLFGLILSYLETYSFAERSYIDLNKNLETKVKERTKILEKQSEEIQRQNEALEKAQAEVISQYYQIQNQNKELEKAKAIANEANQSKSMFIANMSHEIRTPLNAVMGFAEILKEKLHDSVEYQNYLDGIYVGGKNLLNLINDILDISKIEAGKLNIQYKAVDVFETLRDIKQLFTTKINQKGLSFEINVNDKIPSALILDEGRLRQIIFNLVGNAIKFTEKGGIKINLDVKENKETSTIDLTVEVHDTGIGIPRNQQKTIFEPFHQQKDQDSKYGGTGLGLSITKRLVEMMQGVISVKSTLGKGTVFKVVFKNINIGALADLDKVDIDKKVKVKFHGSKILLVEDIKSNRDVIKGYLELHQITIVEAENGEKALQIVDDVKPDLILMDLQMPVLDGFETSKKLKQRESTKNIPILALTASTLELEENVKKVCEEYIRKPVSKYLLISVLAKYLPSTLSEENLGVDINQKNDYLKRLESYLTENKSFPYEMIYIFEEELRPLYEEILLTLSIDECKQFSDRIVKLGKDYDISALSDFGEELLQEINLFKFEEFKQLLRSFPEVLKIINKKTSSYGRK